MADAHGHLTVEDDQEKWLDEATTVVKQQAFFMKRALDSHSLREALKHSSNMICELRTSLLSPKNYYDIYMLVFDELRHLESYFADEYKRGRKMLELYESVQHAGNILPRLYLLFTVGSVYIRSKEGAAKDILKDMIELAKGVQHPMRGLFLRYYLSQMTKGKLPDKGSEYEGPGGDVKDAIDFILQNFGEMNKLWVRMQHQGVNKDRAKREKERSDLRVLVGENLVRLSQLDGLDMELYIEMVLPRLLEQVISCKDTIAQQYLMDCIIQVFPDEFHLHTLEQLLQACTQLQPSVDLKSILVNFMNRLAMFANGNAIPAGVNIFELFRTYIDKIVETQTSMNVADLLQLQVALLHFTLKCYPGNMSYVNYILTSSLQILTKVTPRKLDNDCTKQVMQLLSIPLDSLMLQILTLDQYPQVLNYLNFASRKGIAYKIVQMVVNGRGPLQDVEKVDRLLEFVRPLIKDEDDMPEEAEVDMEEFETEQNQVVRLVGLMQNDDTDLLFRMYVVARKHFGQGGSRRIKFSLVPLVFAALQLVRRIRRLERRDKERAQNPDEDDMAPPPQQRAINTKKVYQFLHETATAMAPHYPEVALRLFLQLAQSTSEADIGGDLENIAYEFVCQAIVVYEDEISDSKAQFNAINLLIATLGTLKCFSHENYDTLITKTTQHAAKLLKKPDQCKAVYLCSHLFWAGTDTEELYRDGKRVLECLQRSLKIADICNQSAMHVPLFIEILNHYLYYFDNRNEAISSQYISGLVDLIREHLSNATDPSEAVTNAKQFLANTLRHIEIKKEGKDGARYRTIEI
eukprot:GILK01001595.1.p1 GENE.GILK01001595.1~~GILK01001595.1.p1  ORF type:complete len:829 (-),score=163.63 GILK01001595.1:162-2573(-)